VRIWRDESTLSSPGVVMVTRRIIPDSDRVNYFYTDHGIMRSYKFAGTNRNLPYYVGDEKLRSFGETNICWNQNFGVDSCVHLDLILNLD
jgi:hypothetical protein